MEQMSITSAQYCIDPNGEIAMIKAIIDGETVWVPNNAPANRHYAAILKAVEAGELTIAPAES